MKVADLMTVLIKKTVILTFMNSSAVFFIVSGLLMFTSLLPL
jgi:hypothetical protein